MSNEMGNQNVTGIQGEEIEADTTSNVEDGFNGNGKEEIGSNFHDLPPSDDKQQILKGEEKKKGEYSTPLIDLIFSDGEEILTSNTDALKSNENADELDNSSIHMSDCAMQEEKALLIECLEIVPLVDAEKECLHREDDQNGTEELSKIEPTENGASIAVTLDDLEVGTCSIQVTQIKQEIENMSETEVENQLEFDFSSVVVSDNVMSVSELIATPVSNGMKEEEMSYESESQNKDCQPVQDIKIEGQSLFELPSSLFSSDAVMSEEIAITREATSDQHSASEADHNSVGMASRDMMNFEEKEVGRRLNLVEKEVQSVPPPSELHELRLNVAQEDQGLQKCSEEQGNPAEDSETTIERHLISTCLASECPDIYLELPNFSMPQSSVHAEPSDTEFIVIQPDNRLPELLKDLEWENAAEKLLDQSVSNSKISDSECLDIDFKVLEVIEKTTDFEQSQSVVPVSSMEVQPVVQVENGEKVLDSVVVSNTEAQEQCLHVTTRNDGINPETFGSNEEFTFEQTQNQMILMTSKIETREEVVSMQKMENEDGPKNYELETYTEEQRCSVHTSESDTGNVHEAFILQRYREITSEGTLLLKQEDLEEGSEIPAIENTNSQNGSSSSNAAQVVCVKQSEGNPSEQEVVNVMIHSNKDESETCNDHIAVERSDSRKLETPLLSFMKEEAQVMDTFEKNEDIDINLNNNEGDAGKPPCDENPTTPPRGKGKHKHRSSLFGNWICCTTATD
ncbi:uncharacterized protein LOC122046226 [Zingiber officinale]|uniref:Uncharacterized protein n=1 Tax=Zingiber officinale TaxID=94328 RepID=A0A8J5LM03_ZINOF|nr:uncharacterized protein LOC122046226 [Zingiber officinale]XP_042462772.1 uncharacterized protein LOC122046226 [Zingiber officinale]KAG6530845.1 hypothetical protein ZIOFF_004606 [Zingiber officinale]